MRFVVLGGTGMMGRIAVRDLFQCKHEVVIASTDIKKSSEAASKYSSNVTAAQIDVKDTAALSMLLRDADVAVNCVQYNLNLDVMRGALKGGAHYVDLGGLYYDLKDTAALSMLLRDADVAVNCVQYNLNLDVMRGALKGGAHYVDLGGLY